MRNLIPAAAAVLLFSSFYSVSADGGAAPAGGLQQGGGRGRGTFPNTQRELASPEVIERERAPPA